MHFVQLSGHDVFEGVCNQFKQFPLISQLLHWYGHGRHCTESDTYPD